jgi:hypothetical protein
MVQTFLLHEIRWENGGREIDWFMDFGFFVAYTVCYSDDVMGQLIAYIDSRGYKFYKNLFMLMLMHVRS